MEQIVAQSRQGRVERASEINVLAWFQAERHLGVRMQQNGDDRLFVLERARPFLFADGFGGYAVARHHEDQACAIAYSFDYLIVPIGSRDKFAFVQPDWNRRRPLGKLVAKTQSEILSVGGGVTDEVIAIHKLKV